MSSVTIKKVESKKDLERFIDFHYDLYEGNEYDAPNLFSDDMNTLSKDKNAAFDFCEAEYFLAYKDGKIVGRVAAIINNKANKKWRRKDVRFGWIDFIDDREVSEALIKAVEDYGKSKGMTHICGPLGFTDMDPEGMLTWGFEELGTMATIYNYPYYPQHIEAMAGFEVDNHYIENKIWIPKKMSEKHARIAEMIKKRYNIYPRKITREEAFGGMGKKVFQVVNDTYKDLYGYSQLTDRQIDQYIKMYMPVLDLDLVTLVEDRTDPEDPKIIGIGVTLPQLSRALQKCRRGRLFPFGWWHLIRALKFHKTEGVDMLLVGILPEYRKKGANAVLFADLLPRYIKYGFKYAETQVEMESNTKVQSMWDDFDHFCHKRRKCYRKEI